MAAPDRRAHVLLIDDHQDILTLFKRLLEGDGYRVTTLREPVDTTQVAALAPDVIVLEVLALGEVVHGWEHLAQLRSDPDIGRIPLVLCTSADLRVEHPTMAEQLEHMGVRVLMKPCSLTDLITAVDGALNNQATAD